MTLLFEISLWTFLVISAVQMIMGTALGWLLHAARQPLPTEAPSDDSQAQKLGEVFGRLYELTGTVGQDVGQHASRVKSIGNELELAKGKSDTELQAALLTAMTQIAEANERLQGQLSSAEQKLQEQAGEIETHMVASRTDALTGLNNRRAFDDDLKSHLARFFQAKTPVSLVLFDVDFFKKFNDTHGHLAGDAVLRGVARTLSKTLRQVGVVARYGGEEFAVIVPDGDAPQAAENARLAIQASWHEFEGTTLQVTVSGGITPAMAGDDPASMIKRADEALYASKKAGRNCLHINDGSTCTHWPLPAEVGQAAASRSSAAQASETAATSATALSAADGDPLNGLPDRHALYEDLGRRLAQRKRDHVALAVILADIDNLHCLNDQHGFRTGDVVLRAVSQFLAAALREMDVIARYDGDRFALVLPSTGLTQAVQIGERVRNAIALCKLRVGDAEVRFTISTGIVEALDIDDTESLMFRCGAALHQAKEAGRNCSFFNDGKNNESATALGLEIEMPAAAG